MRAILCCCAFLVALWGISVSFAEEKTRIESFNRTDFLERLNQAESTEPAKSRRNPRSGPSVNSLKDECVQKGLRPCNPAAPGPIIQAPLKPSPSFDKNSTMKSTTSR